MISDRITIRLADNGFVLEYEDPKIQEQNRKSEGFEDHKDPEVSRVYPDASSLMAGVQAAISVVTGEDTTDSSAEFERAFQEASNA